MLELVPNVQFGSSQIGGVQSAGSQIGGVQKVGINNNTINSINGNKKEGIDYQEIVSLYNDTCVSFPKVPALSEAIPKGDGHEWQN